MIPRIIHYCWFGRNEKSNIAQKCIKSWRKKCKDYKIIEWNEDNFDISQCPTYVQQAYEKKKWAFVTDYVRLKVVFENGGIYFDTDVQVVKSFDEFLEYNAFFGFENDKYVNTGLGFGAQRFEGVLEKLMQQYDDIPFILEDGSCDLYPCPLRNTKVFEDFGLKLNGEVQVIGNNIIVLSKDYMCPIDYSTQKKRQTPNTHSIHWFEASWYTSEEKEKFKRNLSNKKKKERKKRMKQTKHRIKSKAIRILGKGN